MVAPSPEHQAEIDALIRSQARDSATQRPRRRPHEVNATDARIDFDRLPHRAERSIPLLDGRPQHWDADGDGPCRVCLFRPGAAICLKCGRSGYDGKRSWKGEEKDVGGPTSYQADPSGLKGGTD